MISMKVFKHRNPRIIPQVFVQCRFYLLKWSQDFCSRICCA